ncbi:MAG: redoxin domain-containing protein [Candidatus Cloacimonetes bacterium]|nr:redoxin domain-containing protein [Candidatus Cloacimonadota bacterium]
MKHLLIIAMLLTAFALQGEVISVIPETAQSTHESKDMGVMIITDAQCADSDAMLALLDKLSADYPDIVFIEFNLDTEGFEEAKRQVGALEEPMFIFYVGGGVQDEIRGVQTEDELRARLDALRVSWKEKLAARIGFKQTMDFTLNDLDGNEVTLSELEGLIILDFWATWCPPCRAEIPVLQQLLDEHGERGLVVVGVSAEDAQTVKDWVAEQRENGVAMDYYLLIDSERTVSEQYGIKSIPTTYFIAPNGDLLQKHSGFSPEMEPGFRATIEEHLPEGK